jgi:hypothetical protein
VRRLSSRRAKGIDTEEGLKQIQKKKYDAGAKDSLRNSTPVKAGHAHLDALVTAEEASLRARIGHNNVFAGYISKQLPRFSAYISAGAKNYAKLSRAHRDQLPAESQLRHLRFHAPEQQHRRRLGDGEEVVG